jgi:Caspase domain
MEMLRLVCKAIFCTLFFSSVLNAQNLAYIPQYEANINVQKINRTPKAVTMKVILVICDNYVSPENNGIAQSVRVDMGTMTQLFNALERRNIVKIEKTVLQGTKATMANIRSSMKNLQAGSDDIVLFYFSGHGGMKNGKTFLFTADEQELLRSEVEASFNAKPARLKMIITDACSNDVDGLAATRSLSQSGQKIDAGEFDAVYKELFLNYQGMMHISASSEGEYAWSNDNFGGFFTYHFVKEGLIKKPVGDWQVIFKNAKDKTSQMFLRMPSDQRAQLAKEGVKNQTAKAFAMPKLKGENVANNTDNQVSNDKPNNNLPSGKTEGTITVDNYTNKVVNFYIDNNPSNAASWDESKIKNMSVEAGKSVVINQRYAVVGFSTGGEETYYELENGNYFFAIDESKVLDLFYKEKEINAQNHQTVSQTDYTKLLLGSWEWEDAATEEMVLTSFSRNNTFIDKYPTESVGGKWQIVREKLEGKDYTIITFILKQDDDSELEIDYIITLEEEYPDEIQLIFVAAYEGGEEIPYEEAEEYFETTIVMTKVR